ncbi:peptide chain release factor N(5)-glutamine methyltransferase [Pararhodobacter marinus]|uniref:Release factor glutamine methyltransferase n=1 Tax=Pararhodobacter marinus TaxID=2184063 RepID=A0A2U2CA18_9RHOB|nr:peptide chain release factor N(5)-glutamine methyltransferase [Pararhodobacter marinus]PWE28634.1 peptide chain release factor N(5)-glutamine methyltransferase [Pararhodobacter marinus]
MSTARAVLRTGVARLAAAGVADPARDARLLLAHAMDIAPDRVSLILPDALPAPAAERFEAALRRREARHPVSHITGRRAFWGRDFTVTPDVLDPRGDTETLIAEALNAPFARLLDLGTGSGAIAVTLLAERPPARGVATDISQAALDVAGTNARRLGVSDRLELLRSDWFAAVAGRFDLIVSNPPYISEAEMAGLAPEVLHEPHLALTPGGDGLAAYRAIAAGARDTLTPGGRLLVEIGASQARSVAALLEAAGLLSLTVLADLDGHDRVVAARAPL